ncbi:MAG: hypothetical protein ABI954_00365 [Pyrinomonadaceae bacterium]
MLSRNGIYRLKTFSIIVFVLLAAFSCWQKFYASAASSEAKEISANSSAAPVQETQNAAIVSDPPASEPKAAQQDETEPEEGCVKCHGNIEPMHRYNTKGEVFEKLQSGRDALGLSCTTCHGGNPAATTQEQAHVQPLFPKEWGCDKNKRCSSANPERSNTLLAKESSEFVRFINPGDFRVVTQTCGECHASENHSNRRSMMAHGGMLWGAALYNNGGYPLKDMRFGESYSESGAPQSLIQMPTPTREQTAFKGILSFLEPLPRWEISQPGNILRVFERGGRRRLEVGLPDKEEEPGKPDKGLSPRGMGTGNRTDPVYLGLQKTRLLDPTLNFLGTNDHAGDYRSSGCTSCHVIYANDRNVFHSEQYAAAGNKGESQSADASIPKNQSGHPIRHQLTSRIPTAQCMVCHMHPGTNMVASYQGLTWWDNETDGKVMYPEKQTNPTQAEEAEKLDRNPEGASVRGKWSDPKFLEQTGTEEFNKKLQNTQFANSHGHGWMFRSVFNKDRKGNWLDAHGAKIAPDDPDKFKKAVHLKDIHLEKGMHCTDCHFQQDTHGDGNLYTEPRAAIEIGCVDCHGAIQQRSNLFTSGFAAEEFQQNDSKDAKEIERRTKAKQPLKGSDLSRLDFRTPEGKKQRVFQRVTAGNLNNLKKLGCKDEKGAEVSFVAGDILQFSTVVPNRCWRIVQTVDTAVMSPAHKEDFNEKSAYAKTIQKDNATWGDVPKDEKLLAHSDQNMTCYACHSSWMTSCFGCHLSMEANRKMPNRHNEGGDSRNFTSYNYQVLRDEVYMLGKDGTVTGHRVAPVRSSSAVLVSSRNQNREWIYHQQQTVSSEGFSGQSFNTHVPHTVRAQETKNCSDCHVSKDNDNNAWLAQLLLQGTNFVNFIGQYAFVAAEDSLEAVTVTEHTEPQAVLGSTLHRIAYPDNFKEFERGGRELKKVYEHKGNPEVLQVQVRGEYAYVAAGKGGLRVYDVAQIDQKGFSERITTAPVSPFGQRFYVDTKYAAAVAAPSTLAVDPVRWRMMRDEKGNLKAVDPAMANQISAEATKAGKPNPMVNEEQPIHPLYAYLYIADKEEGLILVNAATLLDGDPQNNFLSRALTFNSEGALTGANNITIAGTHAFITTDREVVIVSIDDPLKPQILQRIAFNHPKAIAIQFRYGFVIDADGLKVLDLTKINSNPSEVKLIANALVPLRQANDVYVARTFAYVADGADGLAIINVEKPELPALAQMFNADGKLNDTRGVKVAMTNASLYAYVADGKNGLRVLQLTDPETMPNFAGFSPLPEPRLIASFKTKGVALNISKGLDRDRAADESGNQIAVFGRRGARPFNLSEVNRLLQTNDGSGEFFQVSDDPPSKTKAQTVAPAPNNASSFWNSLLVYAGFGSCFFLVGLSFYLKRREDD